MERETRRAQLLTTARQVFAERGYHATRVDDIVSAAHVARGTFYLYFVDKRGIFEQIVDDCFERITAVIEPIDVTDRSRSTAEQLRGNLRRVLGLFTEEPSMARLLFSDAVGLDPDFDRKLLAFYDGLSALIQRALRSGQVAGLVRPGDVPLRAFCLLGVVKEYLYQVGLRRADFDPERAVEIVLELLSQGILAPAAHAPS